MSPQRHSSLSPKQSCSTSHDTSPKRHRRTSPKRSQQSSLSPKQSQSTSCNTSPKRNRSTSPKRSQPAIPTTVESWMALFADWEKKKHNNNSSPCPSIKDVLVSLASRNCTLLQSKSPSIIEETKTVDEFVYLVLDLFLNHTDHPPGLMIASTIYFGEHS